MYDIVIPVGPNDTEVILKQIEFTKKNCIGYRNIYIIASSGIQSKFDSVDVCFIDETIFPFKLESLHRYAKSDKSQRNGWYFQQLLKLYAGSIIPNILDRWLVIDADTFFLKPVSFIADNKCLYATGVEYWLPYFMHMNRIIPGLGRVDRSKSGICHHMMFEQKFVKEIFDKVEYTFKVPFYEAFMTNVDVSGYEHSGASEYEVYFNYMLTNHRESIQIRPLQWKNVNILDVECNQDYISYHHYSRK